MQATDRNDPKTNPSKGFGKNPEAGQPDSTNEPTRQVGAALAKLRAEVNEAAEGHTSGIASIVSEYEYAIQPVADEASRVIADMLTGGTFYRTVARNVAELMAAHPRAERVSLGKPTLRPLSLKPLQQGTQQSCLGSASVVEDGQS